jgi:hypothetical protein
MNDIKYEILDLKPETVGLYKNCFESNDSPKELDLIQWQFLLNPVKEQYVDIAVDQDKNKTAAIYAVFPTKFKIGDVTSKGTQSLDTITDIDYRGKGLFITLAKDVYQKASDNDVALVYGFPNGNSIHGFEKKLEWKVLDPVPFLIKPLKSSYFIKKFSFLSFLPNFNLSLTKYSKDKNYNIVEGLEFPEAVNSVWKSFSENIKVAVQRDKSYLDWRYIQKPFENYKIAHCYDKSEQYLGFIVYTVKGKHGGKIAYIMEMIYDLKHPKASNKLLEYAISEIRKEQADCILSWCMNHSPSAKTYKKHFFISMPERFRPIELHFGVRSFKKQWDEIIIDRDNWYLSYSDSDTV